MMGANPLTFEWAETWLAAMGRASWQGGIALGLVWIACRAFPQLPPRARCWLWRLALLKMLLAAVVPGTMDLPILPGSWAGGAWTGASESTARAFSSEAATAADKPVVLTADGAGNVSVAPIEDATLSAPAADAPGVSIGQLVPGILLAVWSAVLLGLAGLVAKRVFGSRGWRRRCVLIKDPQILAMGERVARQLNLVQPPVLFEADFCRSPVVFGAMRTAIVLPATLVAEASAAEMRLILAHEMAHIRRGDLLGNWFSTLVSTLFFFHPLVWIAFRETRLAQEIACDELAVRQPDVSVGDYGRLIVDLATRYHERASVVVAVGVVESFHHSLSRRLRAMKNFGTGSWRGAALAWLLAAVAVLGLMPWRVVAHDEPGESRKGAAARNAERDVNVRTKSGPFTITVDRVRQAKNSHPEMSTSGFPMQGMKTTQTSHSETFGDANAGGTASGGGATMGGGHACSFKMPNLVLDVGLDGPKTSGKTDWLCTVVGKVEGEDDKGGAVDSPGNMPPMQMRLSGIDYRDEPGRTAIHLYLPKAGDDSEYLAWIKGSLLVGRGTISQVTFGPRELKAGTTKRDNDVSVQLDKLNRTSEGIDVTVTASPPAGMKAASDPATMMKNPLAHMEAMMRSMGRLNVTLTDSQGNRHAAFGSGSVSGGGMGGGGMMGGGGGGGFSSGGGNGATSWSTGGSTSGPNGTRTWRKSGGSSGGSSGGAKEYHFAPLPKGVTVKSIVCTITDVEGEVKTVPFRLENIPLP